MLWIDAQRRHAEMVERVPGRDRADVQLIREPVGEHLSPLAVALDVEVTVAVRADRPAPDPTAIADTELRFKSLANILRFGASHTANYTTHYTEFIGAQLIDQLALTRAGP